jgi:hypothetical protein
MCAIENFGEAFASKILRRFYEKSITEQIVNRDFEGQIKSDTGGDRLNILSFLYDATMSDYSIGVDMGVQRPKDTEDILIIDKKKYWNFNIDDVEKAYSYATDIPDALVEKYGKALEKVVDQYVLARGNAVRCGHMVGSDSVVPQGNFAGLSSVGVLTLDTGTNFNLNSATLQDKGVYIASFATTTAIKHDGWFKIKSWTNSITMTLVNWDGTTYDKGTQNADYSALTFGAPNAIQITSSNIYAKICDLKTKLDEQEIPDTDRKLIIPAWVENLLIQASQLQPDIAMYYGETVIEGKVGRVAGFDIIKANGDKINVTLGADGIKGYEIIACHTSFITFAEKLSKSRVIDDPDQFANMYQGLMLFGATVASERVKSGAMLFAKQ